MFCSTEKLNNNKSWIYYLFILFINGRRDLWTNVSSQSYQTRRDRFVCVCPQLMADYLFHSISTYNLQCQPLHLSISIFNSILFLISFIFQIHLLTVRNGQYHDRCRNCVWASSAHWIPVNRHSYIAIWPDRICKRNHRKEADSKRRFLSTIKAIYYWSETKGVFPRCRYVDLLDPSNKQKTKSHWSIEWKSSMHLNSPISNHFRRKCLNFFIKKLLSWNARRALPIVSEVKRQKPISE